MDRPLSRFERARFTDRWLRYYIDKLWDHPIEEVIDIRDITDE